MEEGRGVEPHGRKTATGFRIRVQQPAAYLPRRRMQDSNLRGTSPTGVPSQRPRPLGESSRCIEDGMGFEPMEDSRLPRRASNAVPSSARANRPGVLRALGET